MDVKVTTLRNSEAVYKDMVERRRRFTKVSVGTDGNNTDTIITSLYMEI